MSPMLSSADGSRSRYNGIDENNKNMGVGKLLGVGGEGGDFGVCYVGGSRNGLGGSAIFWVGTGSGAGSSPVPR